MMTKPKGVLLLGTSHAGKSTSAAGLAAALDWRLISTDTLGRHPGRPWAGVPDPVIEFYLGLSDDAIHWFLRVHHQNMRPLIGDAIEKAKRAGGFVLEGAALRPEHLDDWDLDGVRPLCLFADDAVLRDRIMAASGHEKRDDEMKRAIDKFIERSLRENRALVAAARERGIDLVDVTDYGGADRYFAALIGELSAPEGAGSTS